MECIKKILRGKFYDFILIMPTISCSSDNKVRMVIHFRRPYTLHYTKVLTCVIIIVRKSSLIPTDYSYLFISLLIIFINFYAERKFALKNNLVCHDYHDYFMPQYNIHKKHKKKMMCSVTRPGLCQCIPKKHPPHPKCTGGAGQTSVPKSSPRMNAEHREKETLSVSASLPRRTTSSPP